MKAGPATLLLEQNGIGVPHCQTDYVCACWCVCVRASVAAPWCCLNSARSKARKVLKKGPDHLNEDETQGDAWRGPKLRPNVVTFDIFPINTSRNLFRSLLKKYRDLWQKCQPGKPLPDFRVDTQCWQSMTEDATFF